MRTSNKVVKLAFAAVSGSGKTTCGNLVKKIIRADFPKYTVTELNVALPLHRIQAYAYRSFGLKNSGQDGKLLQFLAGHFGERLGPTFVRNLDKILAKSLRQKQVIINTDCRNNAYGYLKRAGFIFIKIAVESKMLAHRLAKRADVMRANPKHKVEQVDQIEPDFVIKNDAGFADLERELLKLVRVKLRPR